MAVRKLLLNETGGKMRKMNAMLKVTFGMKMLVVMTSIHLCGCSPSASDVEDIVEDKLASARRYMGHDRLQFSLQCPTCGNACNRKEYEVADVVEDVEGKEWHALIKFYYSCEHCDKARLASDWCKTWDFSLRDRSQSFWESLKHDWILPVRRHPKCLLFKLFSGDFFSDYELNYYYANRSSVENCEDEFKRLLHRYQGWLWFAFILVFLIKEAMEERAKVKTFVAPLALKIYGFMREFVPDCFDILLEMLKNWWRISWWLVTVLFVLQLVVKFWQHWNN